MAKKDVTRLAYTIFWCGGGACSKNNGKEVCKNLRNEVRAAGLKNQVHFVKTTCTGQCKQAPVAVVCSGPNAASGSACGAIWYRELETSDAADLVETHLHRGQVLQTKVLKPLDAK